MSCKPCKPWKYKPTAWNREYERQRRRWWYENVYLPRYARYKHCVEWKAYCREWRDYYRRWYCEYYNLGCS